MALGPLTYKTPNQITTINSDFSGSEGCGIQLTAQGTVGLATAQTDVPYGLIVAGSASVSGSYPGVIAAGALEIVDAYGAVVQATAGAGAIAVGDLVSVTAGGVGTFVNSGIAASDYVWGSALTAAPAGGQFLLRFAPYIIQP